MRRREFISLFAGVTAAWSVAANAEELVPMEITKPSKATLPQIEVPRVKPVDRMPPNVRSIPNETVPLPRSSNAEPRC
jgi:hypothetical protein